MVREAVVPALFRAFGSSVRVAGARSIMSTPHASRKVAVRGTDPDRSRTRELPRVSGKDQGESFIVPATTEPCDPDPDREPRRATTRRSRMIDVDGHGPAEAGTPHVPGKAASMPDEIHGTDESPEHASGEGPGSDAVTSATADHCSLSALLFVARYLAQGSGPKS